jgi:hypothetical protein
MSARRLVVVSGAVAALAAATVPAIGSEPSSGTVSNASPAVAWTGTATGYGVVPANILLDATGQGASCPPGACDTFALKVADGGDLLVTAAQRARDNFTELHVVLPDGTKHYVVSDDSKPATIRIKKAAAGDYGVEVLTNETAASSGEYDASATLGTPKPAATPDAGATPGASTTPAASGTPAARSEPQPAATLSLRTRRASARRPARLEVSASSPVTGLVAQLGKGRKVVARGKLARLEKTGTVALKPRRLKPGTYVVAIRAKDARTGQPVGLRARLKVVR